MRRLSFISGLASVLCVVLAVSTGSAATPPPRVDDQGGLQVTPWEYTTGCAANLAGYREAGAAGASSTMEGVITAQISVDVSLSLRTTDPSDSRKLRLREWIGRLRDLQTQGLPVRISISTYGTVVTNTLPWIELGPAAEGQIEQVIDSLPRDEVDTDHVSMLISANEALEAEAKRLAAEDRYACPMLLWFTDGEYDFDSKSPQFRAERGLSLVTPYSSLPVNSSNEAKIIESGKQKACGSDGVISALRNSRTSIEAIALGNADFTLVTKMVEGVPGGSFSASCDLPPYDGEVNPTTTTAPPTTPPPPPPPCPDGECETLVRIAGSVLATLSRTELSAGEQAEPGDIARITAVSPSGERTELRVPEGSSVSAAVGDATVRIQPIGAAGVLVSIEAAAGDHLDEGWELEVKGAEPDVRISAVTSLTTDLRPRLVGPESVRPAVEGAISVEMVHADGTPASPEELALIDLTASWLGGGAAVLDRGQGVFEGVLTSPEFVTEAQSATLVLAPQTDEPVRLESIPLEVPIDWPGYPRIKFPDEVNGIVRLPTFDSPGSVAVPYELRGPDDGRGCATLRTAELGSERGAPDLMVESDEDCVATNESVVRQLTIQVDRRVEDYVCGDVRFELVGDSTSEPRLSSTTVCVSTLRSRSWWNYAASYALFVIAALLPFFILYWVNRRIGGMPRIGQIRIAHKFVMVVNGSVRDDSGRPAVVGDDFKDTRENFALGGKSLVLAQGRLVLESRAAIPAHGLGLPLLLFSGPMMYLNPTGGPVIVGRGREVLHAGDLTDKLSLPVTIDGLWFVVPNLAGGIAGVSTATLVVVRVLGQGSTKDGLANDVSMTLDGYLLEKVLPGRSKIPDEGF